MRKLTFVLLLLVPTVALAQQGFEITPFYGYTWGGSIEAEDNALFAYDVEVDDSEAYGITFDFPVSRGLKVELLASRQSTQLIEDEEMFGPDFALVDVDVSYYHVGVLYQWDTNSRIEPYVAGGLGVGMLEVDYPGVSDEDDFSASFAGGFKLYFSPHVGLRFDLRGYWTNTDREEDDWDWDDCDDDCWYGDWDDLTQTQASVGLIVAF